MVYEVYHLLRIQEWCMIIITQRHVSTLDAKRLLHLLCRDGESPLSSLTHRLSYIS